MKKKIIYIFILFSIISKSFGQACGGGLFSINFVNSEKIIQNISEYELFAVKNGILLDSIEKINFLGFSIPIDKVLVENIVDKNKKISDLNIKSQWNVSSKNKYITSFHFKTIELRYLILILKIRIENKDFFLLGNFFGGCNREQTFTINHSTLKQINKQ